MARLLIEQQCTVPRYSRIANLCGLSQCVNPSHWRVITPLPPWRVAETDGGWWFVIQSTGSPIKRSVVLGARVDGVVHSVLAEPRRVYKTLVALCGAQIDPSTAFATRDATTCGGC